MSYRDAADPASVTLRTVREVLRGEPHEITGGHGGAWQVDTTPQGCEMLRAQHLREPFARGSIVITTTMRRPEVPRPTATTPPPVPVPWWRRVARAVGVRS